MAGVAAMADAAAMVRASRPCAAASGVHGAHTAANSRAGSADAGHAGNISGALFLSSYEYGVGAAGVAGLARKRRQSSLNKEKRP